MHIDEITGALARSDLRGTEDAFRALVGWPAEDKIEGSSVAQRKAALRAVCDVLIADDAILPGDTFEAVYGRLMIVPESRTYAEAATIVGSTGFDTFAVLLETAGRP